MRLPVEIALLCIIGGAWIQLTFCAKYETNKWTCTCSIARQENLNFVPANCASSCECSPASGKSVKNKWTCICFAGGLPTVVGEDTSRSCFTDCNCRAGTSSDLEPLEKQISSKVVIVILSCVILIALAFIASVLWYVSRKGKYPVQGGSTSADKLTNSSSGSNFISQGAPSTKIYKKISASSFKSFIGGCIPKSSFLFRSRTGTVHGTIIHYPYSELEIATNKFSDTNLIGIGGSSCVYHGMLRDGRAVAIKRMKSQGGPDAEHIFLTEIELISRLHHFHVVPLLGYCLENQGKQVERLLVFEYIANGNLRECLDGDLGHCLDWSTRVKIALGAARGLEYLHEAAAPRILHRDVKSTNILLDEKWRAKITDLGMAKHLHNDGILSCSSSPARMQGTFGYFAPEYAIVGRASLKSDVFSFGVVLLELITGRKPIYKTSSKGEESLAIWAMPRLHDSKRVTLELPDPRLKGIFQEEEMQVMAYLAKECLLLDPDSRPSMSEVVQILSTIAPNKSKRKNLPPRVFDGSSTARGQKCGSLEPWDAELYDTSEVETEEIKQITSELPARCLSPANPRCNFSVIKSDREADKPSSDVEKLMLLTAISASWGQDDEMVDLTEPRLEYFCLPNVGSHIVEIA